jgi:hypothetical protein
MPANPKRKASSSSESDIGNENITFECNVGDTNGDGQVASPPLPRWSCTFVDSNTAGEYVWRPWDEKEFPLDEYPFGPGLLTSDLSDFANDYGVIYAQESDFAAVGCYDDYASDEPMLFCHRAGGKVGIVKLKELWYVAQALERDRTPDDVQNKRTLGPMLFDGLCCHSVVPVLPKNINDDDTWRVFHAFGDIMENCEGKEGVLFDKEKEVLPDKHADGPSHADPGYDHGRPKGKKAKA